ncbi:MAG: response regulator [Melioribacteraceae bacterium]|nr:response regulator [Melioribacteraceae bacterium]
MNDTKKYDSVLVITEDNSLRKGIALSFFPYFSSVSAPSSYTKAAILISEKKYDCVVLDFAMCCKNDLELYKQIITSGISDNVFVLAFSLSEKNQEIIEQNNIKNIVNSIDEVIQNFK